MEEEGRDGVAKVLYGALALSAGGGAELHASSVEKVYFVLEYEMTLINGAKEKIALRKWDSIHIGGGEAREIINETNFPASTLVIVNYPVA